jgi:2-C-methyl-D-erythritol 4-phosphate cytidylyltransferase
MAHTYGIILAGGLGLRVKRDIPKQFLPLGDKPLIAWSMILFDLMDAIDGIIIMVPDGYDTHVKDIASRYRITKLDRTTIGGATRQESACRALKARPFQDDDILLFHDAARPFVTPDCVVACINAAREHGAAGVYIPVRDTIAVIDNGFVSSVPPRNRFLSAQTPQGFRYSIIRDAHERATRSGVAATDDVALVLAAGHPVKMIEGECGNVKITSEYDYHVACGQMPPTGTMQKR